MHGNFLKFPQIKNNNTADPVLYAADQSRGILRYKISFKKSMILTFIMIYDGVTQKNRIQLPNYFLETSLIFVSKI